jgi:hypothetical protein
MTIRNRNCWVLIAGLFALFVCLYVFELPELPLYGDEIGNARRMVENRWHLFDLYRFYRIIGISVNFLAYKVTDASPQALTLWLAVWVLACVGFSAHLFAGVFAQERGNFALTTCLVFLALPFSLYLLLLRVVFHEMVTVTLILLCFKFIQLYAADPSKKRLLWALSLLYAASLFCYESCVLLPVAMALFAWFLVREEGGRKRAVRIIAIGTVTALAVYLAVQFLNYASNPKLSVSAADYASYNIGLTRSEQLLRVVLFLVYHLKWSFQYLLQSVRIWQFSTVVTISAYFVLVAVSLIYVVRKGDNSIDQVRSYKAIATGVVIALCSFGLWSYYWVFKGSMVLPPLYNLYVPAIGIALACAGALLLVRSRLVASLAGIAIFCGILLNMTIILSSRAAITTVSGEARSLARQVKATFGREVFRYKAIVLPPMDPDENYARRKARFESMFRQYLNEEYGHRYEGLIAVAVRDVTGEEATILPHGTRIPLHDMLVMSRDVNKLIALDGDRLLYVERQRVTPDRFGVEWAGYRLEYSLERSNLILSKLGAGA